MTDRAITQAQLEQMIHKAYARLPADPDAKPMGRIEELLFENGGFGKLVGGAWPKRIADMRAPSGPPPAEGGRIEELVTALVEEAMGTCEPENADEKASAYSRKTLSRKFSEVLRRHGIARLSRELAEARAANDELKRAMRAMHEDENDRAPGGTMRIIMSPAGKLHS